MSNSNNVRHCVLGSTTETTGKHAALEEVYDIPHHQCQKKNYLFISFLEKQDIKVIT